MAPLALIGTPLGLLAATVTAVGGALGWAWQASGLGRSRRRATRAVRPVVAEVRRIRRARQIWEHRAAPAARRFADQRRAQRLREVPLDTLREAGAANVRWSALRDAGYSTLADVEELSPRALRAIPGVGHKSAGRVARAAVQLARRIRAEPVDLPGARLETPAALALAAGALDLLEARQAGGDAPAELEAEARALGAELDGVRRESSLVRWVAGLWNPERNRAAAARADRLADDAEHIRDRGLLARAREGRKRMVRHRPTRRDPDAVRRRFEEDFTRCCALLEGLFQDLGLGADPGRLRGRGGLSDEIARRVEAFALHTGAMRATLRRYQEFGAKYLLVQERTVLGDEMGLGKTMQALAAMAHCREAESAQHFFVVAPAGLLLNWLREIGIHTHLQGFLLHGDKLESNLAAWTERGGVAVTSYATLRNLDLGRALAESGGAVALCAVDEAHYAKNPRAGRTRAVRRLLDRSARACLMSGTPMENHPDEFLNLIDAIRPADAAALRGQGLQLDAAAGSVRNFHRAVARVYLRRNQEDVLAELPEKIEVAEWVELSAAEQGAYLEQVRQKNFMGMRQAATAAAGMPSAKLEHLAELLEDHRASGRKVLVFSYFLGVLETVARRFESFGTIKGSVAVVDRQELCDRFQAADGHALLLLQITAGGQGLNLQQASAVVLMEPQTKPSSEAQAVARAHRMGQTRPVIVHRLLARGTCDETLVSLLADKQELFDAYARQSLVRDASGQATETSLARAVVEAEQARLGAAAGGEPHPPHRDAPVSEPP